MPVETSNLWKCTVTAAAQVLRRTPTPLTEVFDEPFEYAKESGAKLCIRDTQRRVFALRQTKIAPIVRRAREKTDVIHNSVRYNQIRYSTARHVFFDEFKSIRLKLLTKLTYVIVQLLFKIFVNKIERNIFRRLF